MLKVRLTDAEISALDCNGVFEDVNYLPAIIFGQSMNFTECARNRLFSLTTEMSNSEDAAAEDQNNDAEMRRFARRAAMALGRLGGKILNAA